MKTMKKWIPILLIIIGIAAILISLSADLFMLGDQQGFGVRQTSLALLGLVFTILGIVLRAIWRN